MKAHTRRGDVFRVKLDPAHGTDIRKTRPAVVLSNDSCNIYVTRMIVLPVTSNVSSLFPGEAMIDIQWRPARALGDQMRSLDKARLGSKIGALSPIELLAVEEAVVIALGFTP